MAATLRDHGLPADVVERGDEADVVVSADRRDDAVALMASHMDEIRDRVDAPEPLEPTLTVTPDDDVAASEDEEASRPLVFERLRRLWLVPVMLVPPLILLGFASVPANFAVIAMIGAMVGVVALRQGRRTPPR